MASRLLDLLFPPRCASCGASGALLCATCAAEIRPLEAQVCAHCLLPLTPQPGAVLIGLCERCRVSAPGPLAGLRVAARYESAVRGALWALKYRGQRRLAEPLGDLLAGAARELAPHAALVIPVPLHPERQRQRGYNQSALLARRVASRLRLPLRGDLLARVRATPPQVGLDAVARRANVGGAFASVGSARAALAGRTVLLVDDVCTTGATLAAAAEALAGAGAGAVWGLAVARPPLGADARPPAGLVQRGARRR